MEETAVPAADATEQAELATAVEQMTPAAIWQSLCATGSTSFVAAEAAARAGDWPRYVQGMRIGAAVVQVMLDVLTVCGFAASGADSAPAT